MSKNMDRRKVEKLDPNKIFYDNIEKLVKNLLIDNINYTNIYYCEQTKQQFKKDTQERGRYILEQMENLKHLIDL